MSGEVYVGDPGTVRSGSAAAGMLLLDIEGSLCITGSLHWRTLCCKGCLFHLSGLNITSSQVALDGRGQEKVEMVGQLQRAYRGTGIERWGTSLGAQASKVSCG